MTTGRLRPQKVGSTKRSHQANARLEDVHRRGNVGQALRTEHSTCGEKLHELTAGTVEPGGSCKHDHVLVVMMGEEMNELQCGRREARIPPPSCPRRYGSDRMQGVTGDRAAYDGPCPPEMAGDEGRQNPPRRAALVRCAEVPDDVDPAQSRVAQDEALRAVVHMKTRRSTPGACAGTIAVGVSKPPFMLIEFVHVDRNERASPEARAAREDQAMFR